MIVRKPSLEVIGGNLRADPIKPIVAVFTL
jgi:hypothetical protein